MFKNSRDWYFYFYTVFASIIIFILAMIAYNGGIVVCLILALINFFFMRFTKFLYDLIAKLLGVFYEKRK